MPTISVGMAVYNTERYVGAATASILDQTFADFELIIIDDGSTDGSRGILERFAARDKRIRLISRENRGISATRNELLVASTGKYYAMMDSDDISLPDRLQRQVAYLENHPECLIVTSAVLLIDPDGDPLRTINEQTTHEEIDNVNMSGSGFFVNNAYMARRQLLLDVGGFRDVEPVEDLDLFLRLAERGRVGCVPEVLYKYRQHATNACRRRQRQLHQRMRDVRRDARGRRGMSTQDAAEETLPDKPPSVATQGRTWAWWALRSGNVKTARKHALAALREAPVSIESWRVLYCALRGY